MAISLRLTEDRSLFAIRLMKKSMIFILFFLLLLFTFSTIFAITLNEIAELSKNPATLFKAQEEIVNLALSNPSSSTVLEVAKKVYSKLKILESAHSTPERDVAYAVVKEDKEAFYTSLSSTKLKALPSDFSLVFNIFDIVQDYSNFFSHISEGDYVDAIKYFAKMRYLYKIPNFSSFLPDQDTSSLWSFFAQGIKLNPNAFDENGAKFIAAILTPYDVRTLYMKTYVWLSGLSVEQAQRGLSVVEFENLISSFSEAKMDPNLLQWKYMTSKYLSLYTSISNVTRQLSQAKDLSVYIGYVPTFYRAIQDFPLQYKKPLSQEFSVYLDLLNQRISTSKISVSSSVISDIRKLATKYPEDVNSSKLMALTLNTNTVNEKSKKDVEISHTGESFHSSSVKMETSPNGINVLYYYISIAVGSLIFFALIPRVRLSIYRIFKFKGMEMNFYFKMISKSPEDFNWHLKLANFYEKIGKYEEAQREYKLAMRLMKAGGSGYEDSK